MSFPLLTAKKYNAVQKKVKMGTVSFSKAKDYIDTEKEIT